MKIPTDVLTKVAQLGKAVLENDGTDQDAGQRLAVWLLRHHPVVIREIAADWGRKRVRGWIYQQTRAAMPNPDSDEQQLLPFAELHPHLEVAPGILKHQRVMTGPDWDAALAIYRNRREQADISLRLLEGAYDRVRPLLEGELTTADVLDQLALSEPAPA